MSTTDLLFHDYYENLSFHKSQRDEIYVTNKDYEENYEH